jgi:hypothetical protein
MSGPALKCPKDESHGNMEELPPEIGKDNQGKEISRLAVWVCRFPNCGGRSEILESDFDADKR